MAILPDVNRTGNLGNVCLSFRITRLKQLFNTRQTLRDIASRYTGVMEGTERQLRAWLADRLRSNHANRLSGIN